MVHKEGSAAEVSEWMTPMVVTITRGTTIREALERLRAEGVSCLPIIGDRGEFVGIITMTDFLRAVAATDEILDSNFPQADDYQWIVEMIERRLGSDKVTSLMTDVVTTVRPDQTMHSAASIMLNNNTHHLAVCKSTGELVGVLSSTDFVRYVKDH